MDDRSEEMFTRRREFYRAAANGAIAVPEGMDAAQLCDAFALGLLSLDRLKPPLSRNARGSLQTEIERMSRHMARGLLPEVARLDDERASERFVQGAADGMPAPAAAPRKPARAEAAEPLSRESLARAATAFSHIANVIRAEPGLAAQIVAAAEKARGTAAPTSGGAESSHARAARQISDAANAARSGCSPKEPTGMAAQIVRAGKVARGEVADTTKLPPGKAGEIVAAARKARGEK